MKAIKLLLSIIILTLSLGLASCKKNNGEEPTLEAEFTDSTGFYMQLDWYLPSGHVELSPGVDSPAGSNIDEASLGTTREALLVRGDQPDGVYTYRIGVLSGETDSGTYTMTFRGYNRSTGAPYIYEDSLRVPGDFQDFKMVKSGVNYKLYKQ